MKELLGNPIYVNFMALLLNCKARMWIQIHPTMWQCQKWAWLWWHFSKNITRSVCNIAINAGGLRNTQFSYHDRVTSSTWTWKLTAFSFTSHTGHCCNFFKWSSSLQFQTTDNFTIIFGYIFCPRCIITLLISSEKLLYLQFQNLNNKFIIRITMMVFRAKRKSFRIPSIIRHYNPCLSSPQMADKF